MSQVDVGSYIPLNSLLGSSLRRKANAHLQRMGLPQGIPTAGLNPSGQISETVRREGDRLIVTTTRQEGGLQGNLEALAYGDAMGDGNGVVNADDLVVALYRLGDKNKDGRLKNEERRFLDHPNFSALAQGSLGQKSSTQRSMKLTEAEQKQWMLQEQAAKSQGPAPQQRVTVVVKQQRSLMDHHRAGQALGQALGGGTSAGASRKPLGQGNGAADFLYHAVGGDDLKAPLLR